MLRKLFIVVIYSMLAGVAVILLCNVWIYQQTKNQIFSDINLLPQNNVGLVLGTSKYFSDGTKNLFFKYRIAAAVQLFKEKKIKHIIVSGDNHVMEYNEAADMKKALLALAIPDSCITLDYAGFRTFDSVVRCKKIFGQDKFTIISQAFHNQRAVFISQHFDIDAVAFSAQEVPNELSENTRLREYLARFKAMIDIYILHTSPKFLGEPIKINV